jgi:phosphodiesterase/alkaline phosphatase D-like protein
MVKLVGIVLAAALIAMLTCGIVMGQAGTAAGSQATPSPAMQKPDITNGPVAEYITDSTCTIGWSTTTPGKMTVRYGTDPKQMSKTAESVEGSDPRNHHVQLSGLSPDTRYYFQVVADGEALRNAGTFSTVGKGDPPTKSKAVIPQ